MKKVYEPLSVWGEACGSSVVEFMIGGGQNETGVL